jgi:hypothetical protein
MDSALLFLLCAVISGFNCFLSELNSSNKKYKAKCVFLSQALDSKQAFFCYLSLAIALKSAVLWLFMSE